jgi:tRNA pseudouridine65 synthase
MMVLIFTKSILIYIQFLAATLWLMCSEQNNISTDKPLEILYQDEHLVTVFKPTGLLVHRSIFDKHETHFALQMVRNQVGQHVYPVQRLDKPISGVLLFALSSDIAKVVSKQFAEHEVQKTYLAIVRGYADEVGMIDYTLKEELDKKSDKQVRTDKPDQDAVTPYKRLNTVEFNHAVGRYNTARYSLVQLEPKTGRKHQLPRHLKHIFHPIMGDTTHGDGKQN